MIFKVDHLIKLPQTSNLYKLLTQSFERIYGNQLALQSKILIEQFVANKNSIKVQSYQFLNNNTFQYLKLLEKHIVLVKFMNKKLQFDQKNYRFLNVQLGWLDTFTQQKVLRPSLIYQLVCVMYNYLMVAVLNSNVFMRKRKWNQVKEILSKSINVGNLLLTMVNKNYFGCGDLHPNNVKCLLKISRGYWFYCQISIREENKQRRLPSEKASMFYSSYKNFKDLNEIISQSKFPLQFTNLYKKLSHFYQILCLAQFCTRMIKQCDLYVTDKPQLFKDALGYCIMGLKCIPKYDDSLQNFEWTILEGKRDELGRTLEHLKFRNQQIYKVHPTPQEILPQNESKQSPQQIQLNENVSQRILCILNMFWDETLDNKIFEVQKYVTDSVEKVKNQFVLLQNSLTMINQEQKIQKQNFFDSVKCSNVPHITNEIFQTFTFMKNQHFLLQRKICEIKKMEIEPKIQRWCVQNLKKLQQGRKVNQQLEKTFNSRKKKLSQIVSANTQKLLVLNQKFQSLFSKIQQLQQLKLKPYHKIMTKKWKQNKLQVATEDIILSINHIVSKWEQQIKKMENLVLQTNRADCAKSVQFINAMGSIKNKQQFGLNFYSKLSQQVTSVESKLRM